MSKLVTPELAGIRQDLEAWVAGEYLVSLLLRDTVSAFNNLGELGVLAATEVNGDRRSTIAISKFEIIDAALDYGLPFFDSLELPFVGHTLVKCSDLLRFGFAGVKPGGTYDEKEIIEGFNNDKLKVTVS